MEAEQKKILKPLVLTLRHLLEGRYDEHGIWHGGDLEARMNSLGVWWDRDSLPPDEVTYQSAEDRHAREVIDAYLTLREEAGIDRKAAIEEFVRETAYTWANRLLVLRCMEARDLIDPQVVLTKEVYGGRSQAHNRLVQRHPERCSGPDGGLFAMFKEAFVQHARYLPLLFDPKAPGVALRPSVAALKKCIGLLSGTESVNGNGPATDEVFAAPDALGWAYQYWNTEEKDRVFEKVRTKKAKIQGADIIPATQLYTEPYMVKFLVQNSLGATWMGMYPDSDLSEGWEYYVKDADRAPVRRKNVENITFLDPACGSGHFLIEAFDLFYRMYEAEGKYTDPETICKKILSRNLYGIDIDERAVQIARAALWMKAAERVFDFSGTPKNIIATNIRLPKGKDHLKTFLAKHPEDAPLQPALETIFEGLAHADELGSLLQIEEPVERELRHLRERLGGQTTLSTGGLTGQTSFAGTMTDEAWDAWRDGVIERLADHFTAEAEAADLVNAFFSRNAGKGVRLFELLSKQYDVVAANPPYMSTRNMSEKIKNFISDFYPFGKSDLYLSFILRCIDLSKKYGQVAMVTMNKWMLLQSFKEFRQAVIPNYFLYIVVDLGGGGFEEISGEVVKSSLFVLKKDRPEGSRKLIAIDLNNFESSEHKKQQLLSVKLNDTKSLKYERQYDTFLELPTNLLIYWLNKDILNLVLNENFSLSNVLYNANCSKTGNNLHFLRFEWEIPFMNKRRWVKYTKGGPYKKWSGNDSLYVEWRNGIQMHYREDNISRITERKYWYNEGVTFSTTATDALSARIVQDSVYDMQGPTFFPKEGTVYRWAAVLNSTFSSYIAFTFNRTMVFQISDVLRIPFMRNQKIEVDLDLLGRFCFELKRSLEIKDKYLERDDTSNSPSSLKDHIYHEIISDLQINSVLNLIEGYCDELILVANNLNKSEFYNVSVRQPVGTLHLIHNYSNPVKINWHPDDIEACENKILRNLGKININANKINSIKNELRMQFEGTSDIADLPQNIQKSTICLPTESLIERYSNNIGINPISVYWLLKEGIEQEGWRCIPEERRITEDRFTVMILRMLGHRWPKQIEAGEPVPDWADADGIIPLTSDTGEATLLERVRARIAAEFPGGSPAAIEREFEEVMGKSLEDWLHLDFFKHHTKQFKKRPIAWQVQSGRFTKKKQPAFACMVYYHKLDEDSLHKIKNQYVGPLRQKYETEMRGIEGIPVGSRTETQEKRYRELTDLVAELKVFGDALSAAAENGFSSKVLDRIAKKEPLDAWCSIDGRRPAPADQDAFLRQERAYIPDINDGVRVNVAPLQKAGLLAADVIAKKDLEKAISDRAEWRADERRWCREGKLPKCGWWPQEEAP